MMTCVICKAEAVYNELCKNCWVGLKCFQRNKRLLGRAISYLSGNANLRTKRERRAKRKQASELSKLIAAQKADERDRELRFEHALKVRE